MKPISKTQNSPSKFSDLKVKEEEETINPNSTPKTTNCFLDLFRVEMNYAAHTAKMDEFYELHKELATAAAAENNAGINAEKLQTMIASFNKLQTECYPAICSAECTTIANNNYLEKKQSLADEQTNKLSCSSTWVWAAKERRVLLESEVQVTNAQHAAGLLADCIQLDVAAHENPTRKGRYVRTFRVTYDRKKLRVLSEAFVTSLDQFESNGYLNKQIVDRIVVQLENQIPVMQQLHHSNLSMNSVGWHASGSHIVIVPWLSEYAKE
jgi:hypothetical protein